MQLYPVKVFELWMLTACLSRVGSMSHLACVVHVSHRNHHAVYVTALSKVK